MLDFLKALLLTPVALTWLLLSGACLVLLLIATGLATLVSMLHLHLGKSWRDLLVTTTRVRISWIWGWAASCLVLLGYAASLAYLGRVESWYAALPYLIVAATCVCIAALLRHSVRARLIRMQRLVQGGRP
jgi:hypothetical protein